MYGNIFKPLLILFLILRICYTGIAKEFKREPNNGDPTDTLYRVEIKNLKTNEIYNAEYTTDANNVQVDIMRGKTHLYYKNEFFASGAFISFELPRAGKTVTEGNREKFDVTLKIEKFKRLSNFVSKEKSEKPGTIEFKITDGGDLWLTDLKNDIRITSKMGKLITSTKL